MTLIDGRLRDLPASILVVGGGRWARVLVDVLSHAIPVSMPVTVCSARNVQGMAKWTQARGLSDRVEVRATLPATGAGAVIVANAACDHETTVEWAVSRGCPTLVEKPIARSAAAAQRLLDLARASDVTLAASHVFLFATYFQSFCERVAAAGPVESVRVRWSDPETEHRYGEAKRYDPSLPVFADWLPHVFPIVKTLLAGVPVRCAEVRLAKGGARVELELAAEERTCSVMLERNGTARQRVIDVCAGGETLQLDFAREPGTIMRGGIAIASPESWEADARPLSLMLRSFLAAAGGGELDPRLDPRTAVASCALVDEVAQRYGPLQDEWVAATLSASSRLDPDLRYALSERLQAEGVLSEAELVRRLEEAAGRPTRVTRAVARRQQIVPATSRTY